MPSQKAKQAPEILFADDRVLAATGQCDCDCDCACVLEAGPADRQTFKNVSHWQTVPRLSTFSISESHQAVFNPQNPARIAVLNQAASQMLIDLAPGKSVDDLYAGMNGIDPAKIQDAVETLAFLKLVQPSGNNIGAPVWQPTNLLTAWLHLTDRCNLRCDYCYLPHHQTDMSIATGKAAIKSTFLAARKYGYSRVKLKYGGGETLLRFKELIELNDYSRGLAQSLEMGIDSIVLSNGILLTPEMAIRLKEAGMRLMISLDGLDQRGASQRHDAAGQSSNALAMRGIETAIRCGLKPEISITISNQNAAELAELVRWVLGKGLQFSINFYRENELSASHSQLVLKDDEMIAGMRAAFKVIEEFSPAESMLAALLDRTNLSFSHNKACSAGSDYLVFGTQGQILPCQMLLNTSIGTHETEDPLALVRSQKSGLQNLPVQQKSDCKQCQWQYWCAGGCPISTYRATGRYDQKSPNCHIYQSLFPDIIRLEGMRLLKNRH